MRDQVSSKEVEVVMVESKECRCEEAVCRVVRREERVLLRVRRVWSSRSREAVFDADGAGFEEGPALVVVGSKEGVMWLALAEEALVVGGGGFCGVVEEREGRGRVGGEEGGGGGIAALRFEASEFLRELETPHGQCSEMGLEEWVSALWWYLRQNARWR